MNSSTTTIPWFAPEMVGTEHTLLSDVLASGFVNEGPVTKRFEMEIAKIAGTKYAVTVTSGTAAIACALMAAGIGPGDEVLVPDFTFVATANAVRLAGAKPVLVDIEGERFTLDAIAAAKALTPHTRAVVTVDVNGRGAAYEAIEPLCVGNGLLLITDSAEGLGSKYRGRPLGSFGIAGCFSFSPSKFVTTGQGGAVTTSDEAIYRRLIEIKDQGRSVRGTGGDDLHPALGYNFKFTDLQAALGLAQLTRLQERIQTACRRDAMYQECLGNIAGLRLGPSTHDGEVRLWTDAIIDDRGCVEAALKAAGIGFRNFWFPNHTQAAYRDQNRPFPVTSDISRRGLWLPSHFRITPAEIEKTCDVVKRAIAAAR